MAGVGQSSRPTDTSLKLAGGQTRLAQRDGCRRSRLPGKADKRKLVDGQACRLDAIKNFTNIFYDPRHPCSFSTYEKLYRTVKTQSGVETSAVKSWLEQQNAYTLHKPIRKRFPRNPYTVNNIMDLLEANLVDVESLAKHNDGYRYLLTVIDVFTKHLHIVPLKSKTSKAVSERSNQF